jgi:hypothetical protein
MHLLSPVFFDFRGQVKLNRIDAHDFQLGAAVAADDDLAFLYLGFQFDLSITFWTSSHFHFPPEELFLPQRHGEHRESLFFEIENTPMNTSAFLVGRF